MSDSFGEIDCLAINANNKFEGYLDEVVYGNSRTCPTDEWYKPDVFEDWSDVVEIDGDSPIGYYYWDHGSLWCLYEQDGDLIGSFHPDSDGPYTMSWNWTDGSATVGFSLGGTGASGSRGDSIGGSFSVNLSPDNAP